MIKYPSQVSDTGIPDNSVGALTTSRAFRNWYRGKLPSYCISVSYL